MAVSRKLVREDRTAGRGMTDVSATLRHAHNVPVDVVVEDLSVAGFRMRTDALLRIGQKITIGIAAFGQQRAKVVRRTDTGYGCEFEADEPGRNGAPSSRATVIPVDFQQQTVNPEPIDAWFIAEEPTIERFSPRVRAMLMIGLGVACWLAVIGLFALL